jgi:hypothetical protein
MSDRTTVVDDPLNEQTTAMQIQTSVSVGHEDLLDLVETSDISTKPGGPPRSQDPIGHHVSAGYS